MKDEEIKKIFEVTEDEGVQAALLGIMSPAIIEMLDAFDRLDNTVLQLSAICTLIDEVAEKVGTDVEDVIEACKTMCIDMRNTMGTYKETEDETANE